MSVPKLLTYPLQTQKISAWMDMWLLRYSARTNAVASIGKGLADIAAAIRETKPDLDTTFSNGEQR